MNIFLEDNGGKLIPSDIVISWIARSDLTPVPRTVEFSVQNKNGIDEELVVGGSIWTGLENLEYTILKVDKGAALGALQGDSPLQAFTVFAVLASTAKICFRQDRPVIKRQTTIGGMYRACGANVSIENDINIASFASLQGDVPSFAIARSLQELSAVLVYRDKKLSALRLAEMMKQEPVDEIGQANSADTVDSEFIERHEVASFYTIKPDGTADFGNFDKTRAIQYIPQKEAEELYNLSRVLITRQMVDADMTQSIQAGDILRVNGNNFAVITAAHYAFAVDGIKQTGSKFWIGDLV
jgi:hypothetical protein